MMAKANKRDLTDLLCHIDNQGLDYWLLNYLDSADVKSIDDNLYQLMTTASDALADLEDYMNVLKDEIDYRGVKDDLEDDLKDEIDYQGC